MSSPTGRPNVLFIMTDQMKAGASHLYGNTFCETPSLERLAAEGVRFEHAYTPHPLCVPARVALWTGRYPHATGARRNETLMPAGERHAFEIWSELGYRCGLIGKNHCFETDVDLALFDVWCELSHRGLHGTRPTRGMEWPVPLEAIRRSHAVKDRITPEQSPRFSYATTDFPLEEYSTGLITEQTVRFLESHGTSRRDTPFALWVSFPDPHEPYEAPRRYADMFAYDRITLPPWEDRWEDAPERNRVLHAIMGMEEDDPNDVAGALSVYYGNVRFIDDGVGRILDALERLGLRESTIVVFCSDHGDFAGEHAMMVKGGVFYDALTRVPLLVSWPGTLPTNCVEPSMVNLVDLVPTLFTMQGIEVPRAMQGRPLPGVTNADPRDDAFSEYGAGGPAFTMADLERLPRPWGRRALIESLQWREAEGRRKMVRTREWKYVHDPMGDRDELYDLRSDPWEQRNRAGAPELAPVESEMRRRLADWMIATEDATPVELPPARSEAHES